VYEIRFAESVSKDLEKIPAHYRNAILDAIERHLSQTPGRESRKRKILLSLVPSFEAVPPVWELRVGNYRVFYDVDEEARIVFVRLVRKKPPHLTTEDII